MDIQITNFLNIINAAIHGELRELSSPDWNVLYSYGRNHEILPVFFEGCNKYIEFYSIPDDVREKFLVESVEIIMWQAGRTESFLNVYDKLTAEGLKPLIVKGLICRNTYNELADHRPSSDEDIYIKVEEFESYKDILTHSGFTMENVMITDAVLYDSQEISFYDSSNGLHIEVHLSLMGKENSNRKKMNLYFKDVFDDYISFEINNHLVYSLNHTDHYLYLFLHFYKHFTLSGVGIRQIIDILMYGQCYGDQINWEFIHERIKEMSADKLYSDLITIGNRYLGFEAKTDFVGCNEETLIEDIMNTGVFGNDTKEQVLSGRFTTAALVNGKNSIIKTLFPKASAIKKGYPILYKKPYLLPFMWIKRSLRFVIKNKKASSILLSESMKIGKRRVQLLKKYGIIS